MCESWGLFANPECSNCTRDVSNGAAYPDTADQRLLRGTRKDCHDLHGGSAYNAFLFGLCIGVAQLAGTMTASFTGTLAPLLFHFRFETDPGMWAGPLETCVQDVLTSGALTFVSAAILGQLWS